MSEKKQNPPPNQSNSNPIRQYAKDSASVPRFELAPPPKPVKKK